MNHRLSVCTLPLFLFAAGCADDPPDSDFPEPPAGAQNLVYVSAKASADGANGTAEHPFRTISEALKKGGKGATVLVAKGTYKENLDIQQDAAVVGFSTSGDRGLDPGIILQAPKAFAINIGSGAVAMLQGVHVSGAEGAGVWAEGAEVTLLSSRVEGTTKLPGQSPEALSSGVGVIASKSAKIILQDSAILDSAHLGVLVTGSSGTFTDSEISGNGSAGIRLDLSEATVENNLIASNHGYGVGVFSSTAIILQNQVHGTKKDETQLAAGIIAIDLAGQSASTDVRAETNDIQDSERVGILCGEGANKIILQDNAIGGSAAASGAFGAGIWIQNGAGAGAGSVIAGNKVRDGKFVGIGMSGETGSIKLDKNEVTGTKMGTVAADFGTTGNEFDMGDGLNLFDKASAEITGNTFGNNARFGMIFDQQNVAGTSLDRNTISGNFGVGIILQNQDGKQALPASNSFSGNKGGNTETPQGKGYGLYKLGLTGG